MMMSSAAPLINPYIAGNPVHGDMGFFGRRDILRQVERILATPGQNAVVLFGQRRVGKTSILLQLQHILPSDQYTVVYHDLQDKACWLMGELLSEVADDITFALELDDYPEPFDDHGRAFQHDFLPWLYNQLPNSNQRLVLLFDEFDVLNFVQRERLSENAAANQLFPVLRRWLREEPRLAFVFALGRNLYDLDGEFLSTFKGSQTVRISVLSCDETIELVTSPANLRYSDGAIERIVALTNGHPHLTQLLCSLCFDRAHEQHDERSAMPEITEHDVDALTPLVFSRGENIFAWIWDGLPPAERIIASTLAELLTDDKRTATEDEIETALRNEGIQVITHDLQVSPKKLVEWQLLEERDSGQFQFLVPIMHHWIRTHRPLADTRDEIDALDPRAHRYFLMAKEEYQNHELSSAKQSLNRALVLNPDHLQAKILLGDSHFEDDEVDESIRAYERAYLQDKKQVESKLLVALLRKVENPTPTNILAYKRILDRIIEIDPNQCEIQDKALYFNIIIRMSKKIFLILYTIITVLIINIVYFVTISDFIPDERKFLIIFPFIFGAIYSTAHFVDKKPGMFHEQPRSLMHNLKRFVVYCVGNIGVLLISLYFLILYIYNDKEFFIFMFILYVFVFFCNIVISSIEDSTVEFFLKFRHLISKFSNCDPHKK